MGMSQLPFSTNFQPTEISQEIWLAGTIKQSSEKCGFIEQDNGERDMFCLPLQCPGGVCPPQGTRVAYTVELDPKSGRPRAAQVLPEQEVYQQLASASAKSKPKPSASVPPKGQHARSIDVSQGSGTVKQNGMTWGFIAQDNGSSDLFVMPIQCAAF